MEGHDGPPGEADRVGAPARALGCTPFEARQPQVRGHARYHKHAALDERQAAHRAPPRLRLGEKVLVQAAVPGDGLAVLIGVPEAAARGEMPAEYPAILATEGIRVRHGACAFEDGGSVVLGIHALEGEPASPQDLAAVLRGARADVQEQVRPGQHEPDVRVLDRVAEESRHVTKPQPALPGWLLGGHQLFHELADDLEPDLGRQSRRRRDVESHRLQRRYRTLVSSGNGLGTCGPSKGTVKDGTRMLK